MNQYDGRTWSIIVAKTQFLDRLNRVRPGLPIPTSARRINSVHRSFVEINYASANTKFKWRTNGPSRVYARLAYTKA